MKPFHHSATNPTTIAFVLMFTCLFFVTKTLANDFNLKAMQGLGDPKYHQLITKKPTQTYHLFVRLPSDYDIKAKYPVVYLLDGGLTFPLLASYYQYMEFTQEVPKLIIVGISYGTSDFKLGNNRSRDFTAKSKERSYWGGAGAFERVLSEQVIPLVESRYAADSTKRIIFGQSLGGQFVLYTAMTNPGLFAGYIASNPALHRNLDFFLQDLPEATKNSALPRLFVSDGSDDDPRFRVPALKWMAHWSKQTQLPWVLKTTILEGQSHMSAAPAAFRQGIKWILSAQ